MRFRQVLAIGSFPFIEIGHCIQAHAVHSHAEPEVDDPEKGLVHCVIVEIEIRLMGVEPMPEIGLGHRVPGPVGVLKVLEDDPGFLILVRSFVPDIEVALRGSGFGLTRFLEPFVLIRGVVQDQFGDDAKATGVGRLEQIAEVLDSPVVRMDILVVSDIVSIVP